MPLSNEPCRFPVADIQRLLDAAAAKQVETIFFVHDQGIYLMGKSMTTDSGGPIIYAEGCDPKQNEDWWETARALVGGDDFGEEFTCAEFASALRKHPGATHVELVVSETQIVMRTVGAAPRKAPSRRPTTG